MADDMPESGDREGVWMGVVLSSRLTETMVYVVVKGVNEDEDGNWLDENTLRQEIEVIDRYGKMKMADRIAFVSSCSDPSLTPLSHVLPPHPMRHRYLTAG